MSKRSAPLASRSSSFPATARPLGAPRPRSTQCGKASRSSCRRRSATRSGRATPTSCAAWNLASALGAWSYQPYDTKLARETRGGTILQLATYVDLLGHIQGVRPERFYVVSPGPANGHTANATTDSTFTVSAYRIADFAAYFRFVRRQFQDLLTLDHQAVRDRHYPEPVEACEVCRWQRRCLRERRRDDHLSFISGATRLQRQELDLQGYSTLAAAAAMPVPVAFTPARGSRDGYTRLAHQARLQHRQRTEGRPVHELLDLVPGQGLARLPEPSAGDLFLDLEGARFARDGGREYLFGVWAGGASAVDDGSVPGSYQPHLPHLPRSGPRPMPKNGRRSKRRSTPSCSTGRPIPACTSTTSATTSRRHSRS